MMTKTSRWNRFRWWLATLIAPRWKLRVHVEIEQESFKGHNYKEAVFTDIPSLLDGSGDLYFTREKLPYLTIMQQGDDKFREALMIADVRKRSRK